MRVCYAAEIAGTSMELKVSIAGDYLAGTLAAYENQALLMTFATLRCFLNS